MKETDIVHENGDYFVACRPLPGHKPKVKAYHVFKNGPCAAISETTAYASTPDGLSLAKARCDYLAKRAKA